MEAQVENTTQAKPQSIVEQLLEIAKTHDAMDVIGGSTSWRWQEGLITRMPKTKTVAAILTKAFKSDDPNVWLGNIDGVLNRFIRSSFKIPTLKMKSCQVENIYEAFVIMTSTNGKGANYNQLIESLSVLKFAYLFKNDEDDFIAIDKEIAVNLNRCWAKKSLDKIINKYEIPLDSFGNYNLGSNYFFSDEDFLRYRHEISLLRHKLVGATSELDMWKDFYIHLTDDEMIKIEYKIIEYYKELISMTRKSSELSELMGDKTDLRYFSFSSITLPTGGGIVS